ncbi:MAG: F0F1 ATP synthase subunit delta, partial [Betaproteobacteria bacterium]|nr:F0F1 ATP synthase subunit delta [Betaproteobacteria bacterium]
MAEPSTIARPYAEAAFQQAKQASDLAGWSRMIARLASR